MSYYTLYCLAAMATCVIVCSSVNILTASWIITISSGLQTENVKFKNQKYFFYDKYRITTVMQRQGHIFTGKAASVIRRAVFLVIMFVLTLKTDVIVFTPNIIMCLMSRCRINALIWTFGSVATVGKLYILLHLTRTPLKTGGELRCSSRVSSSCSTRYIHRVNLVIQIRW